MQGSPDKPKANPPLSRAVPILELAAAALVTLFALYLHAAFVTHAGGLWRDEANAVNLSTLPTVGDVWRNMQSESSPLLWLLLVRGLSALGLATDAALRVAGAIVGISIVGVLWLVSRSFRTGPPLFSLALLAVAPSIVIWGDSVRAHGLGVVTALLAWMLLWRLAEEPVLQRLIAATFAAVVAVQCSYYNCVIVLGACSGVFAISLRRHRLRPASMALIAGIAAALSIVPYLSVVRRTSGGAELEQLPVFTFHQFWLKIGETFAPTGPVTVWIWLSLLLLALIRGLLVLLPNPVLKTGRQPQDVILFNATALVAGVLAFYVFLKILRYPTQPWYYLPLLCMVAAGVDAILGSLCAGAPARVTRILVCLGVFALSLPGSYRSSFYRLTNIDLVAAEVAKEAGAKDLIIVSPWYCGVSYGRYHAAAAPWTTLPALESLRFHRYDLIKKLMMEEDQSEPVASVLDQIQTTLKAGGHVFLVGGLHFVPPGTPIPMIPSAPHTPSGWSDSPYLNSWSMQAARFVRIHAAHGRSVPPLSDRPVNPSENLALVVVDTWREMPPDAE